MTHLTAEESATLLRRWREWGDRRARDRVVEGNLGLVRALAARIVRPPATVDDLAQEGAIALVRACDRWDPAVAGRQASFATYAHLAALRRMTVALLRARFVAVPVSRHGRRAAALLGRIRQDMDAAGLTGEARRREVGRRLGMPADVASDLERVLWESPLALEMGSDGESWADGAWAADPAPLADEVLAEREERQARSMRLRAIVPTLPTPERVVIEVRYMNGQVHSLREAGMALGGRSREWARQVEVRALDRLREGMGVARDE